MPELPQPALEHFRTHGWVRVEAAFSADNAAAMCDVIWRALAGAGIRRNDPSTWTKERPEHLQQLKSDPVFHAVGTERTIRAIDEVLEGRIWPRPKDWGAFFPAIPLRNQMGFARRRMARGWRLYGSVDPALGSESSRDAE
jgi:hypothetical protein